MYMNKKEMLELCREKIIMANNPQCKTYEDALQEEKNLDGCIFYNEKHKMFGMNKPTNTLTRCEPDYSGYNGEWFLFEKCGTQDDDATLHSPEYYKILGRPLTLEMILVALKNTEINKFAISYKTNKICLYKSGLDKYFDWKLNQTLDYQSDQTIESIYNLLIS